MVDESRCEHWYHSEPLECTLVLTAFRSAKTVRFRNGAKTLASVLEARNFTVFTRLDMTGFAGYGPLGNAPFRGRIDFGPLQFPVHTGA